MVCNGNIGRWINKGGQVTYEMLYQWLMDESQEPTSAIEMLVEMINGQMSIDNFEREVEEFCQAHHMED